MLITTLLKSGFQVLLFTVLSVSIGQLNLVTLADETKKPESEADATNSKDESSTVKHPANRLAKESSPYLLMHAHNPVDWYAWGPEAFEKAKKEAKLKADLKRE